METINAMLSDVYENIDRRLGKHAWVLPWAVAAGAFIVNRKYRGRSNVKSLISSAMLGSSVAGIVAAGKAAEQNAPA